MKWDNDRTLFSDTKHRPILVVCYTNHALDQFLEGIHQFHPKGIVRVGGRSQSEIMKACSLSELKHEMHKVRVHIQNRLCKTPGETLIRKGRGGRRKTLRNRLEMFFHYYEVPILKNTLTLAPFLFGVIPKRLRNSSCSGSFEVERP